MHHPPDPSGCPGARDHVLLWDLAGTLIPFDRATGTMGALPGSRNILPELGRRFRQVVTTGEETESARGLLTGFGLADNFEQIFGGLFAPLGKPYGEILRHLKAKPASSLAIGDRLGSDLASDTPEVVTLLLNQDGDIATAEVVAAVVDGMLSRAACFPSAFSALCKEWAPDHELAQELMGGRVTGAWRGELAVPCLLLRFEHPMLDGDRMIVQI